mmetsp:Transcript_52023/g.106022  ORF Transcript_52023/g.106022 Transcript_52023/m.106022 type:complete len:109 (-) Transcript_52023:69-395(-)
MSAKIIAFSAVVASATAFSPAALPSGLSLRSSASSAVTMAMDKRARAPVVTVFDHRGCSRGPKEYSGNKADAKEDEMLIKVSFQKIQIAEGTAVDVLQQTLSSFKNPK